MKKIILLIGIVMIIIVSGCTRYSEGTYGYSVCEAPYTNNLTCDESKACYQGLVGMNINERYINDKCK